MAEPYLGEIRMFAGGFAPSGWMFCDGQILLISQAPDLFNLLGTTYGGDGQTTFGLPDLRGRLPLHIGTQTTSQGTYTYDLSQAGGVNDVTLSEQQIPAHNHPMQGTLNTASTTTPSFGMLPAALGESAGQPAPSSGSAAQAPAAYGSAAPTGGLQPQAITPLGGSTPHTNLQPYLCLNFIISLFGIFPSPT